MLRGAATAPHQFVRAQHTSARLQPLIDTVRTRDYAAYLSHVAYPPRLQPHFWALRAFHIELASIKDVVSNELVGRIRMQWWRDAIEGVYANRPPKHPIALGLCNAVMDPAVMKHGSLVKDHFLHIIDAREADLAEPLTPPTLEELETYAEATSSRILYLLLNLQGISESTVDGGMSRYARQAGGVPRTPTLPLPLEYIMDAGVSQEDVYRHGPHAHGLKNAVFATATRANDYLITARSIIRDELHGRVPAQAVAPMLLLVCILWLSCVLTCLPFRSRRVDFWKNWRWLTLTLMIVDYHDVIGSCLGICGSLHVDRSYDAMPCVNQ